MKFAAIALGGAWLALGAAGYASALEPVEQHVLTSDGALSGLSPSALYEMILKADLRQGIQKCVSKSYEADVRIYGTLRFDFLLYPGGGVDQVKFEKSGFERMGLPGCIDNVIKKRLRGQRDGVAALVSAKFDIKPGEEDRFGLSVSARLSHERLQDSSALGGRFYETLYGPVSMCSLGNAALVLRLSSSGAQKRSSLWSVPDRIPEAVEHCLLLPERTEHKSSRHRSRRAKRIFARRRIADCLKEVLKTGTWTDRAYAAEEIADNWRYRARRQIRKTIQNALCAPLSPDHDSNGKSSVDSATRDESPARGFEPNRGCYNTRLSNFEGHALVRMLRAQLRMGLRSTEGVMRSLARHPDPDVRLRLLDTVMSRWLDGLPEGLSLLIHDPDLRVRTRAQQIGCIRADWQSLHAFENTMTEPDPVARAMALLTARSCAEKNYSHMIHYVRRENEPVLRMLMLRVLPVHEDEMIMEFAGPALFDPCPVVRYLAIGLVARMLKPPLELIKQFMKRERDPFILKEAKRVVAEARYPKDTWEQVWLIQKSMKQKSRNLVHEHDGSSHPVGKLAKEHPVLSN